MGTWRGTESEIAAMLMSFQNPMTEAEIEAIADADAMWALIGESRLDKRR